MEKEGWENKSERSTPQTPQEPGIQAHTYLRSIVLVSSLAIKSQSIANIFPQKS